MLSSAKKAAIQPFRDRLQASISRCPPWCINKAAWAGHGEPATVEEEAALNAWEEARDSYELASAWWDQVNLYGNTVTEAMILDFSHVYLLGWNDETGKSYLTSWGGDREVYDFVVVGAGESGPPLWGRQGESGVRLEPMPPGLDHGAQITPDLGTGSRIDNFPKRFEPVAPEEVLDARVAAPKHQNLEGAVCPLLRVIAAVVHEHRSKLRQVRVQTLHLSGRVPVVG